MMTFNQVKGGVFALLLFSSLMGFSIGRSGDGKSVNSIDLGFEASVPLQYNQTRQYKDGTLSIFYLAFGSSVGLEEQSLRFHELNSIYPELVGLSRERAAEFLLKAGGAPIGSRDRCVQAYRIESKTLIYTVFQWAPMKGVVVMGKKDSATFQSLNQVEESLTLFPGACGWN